MKEKDIFDKIMEWPFLAVFNPIYKKYKQALLYLFFGGVSVLINMSLFIGINTLTPISELINNIICWFVCVLFQFFTNRTWVFETEQSSKSFVRQMLDFFAGRLFTLLVEELIILIFITVLGFDALLIKIIAQVIIIVLNYLLSKLWVFK